MPQSKIGKSDTIVDSRLRFIINEISFTVEVRDELESESNTLKYWKDRFRQNKYEALYNIGFQPRPEWLDVAGLFLYRLSDAFQKYLLRQPDIEILRDRLKFTIDEDIISSLLTSVQK